MVGNSPSQAAAGRACAPPALVEGLVNHCILARDMPVAGLSVYRRDVLVRKRLPSGVVVGKHGTGGRRAEILEFSMQSRMRLLHTIKNSPADFFSMLTLTYPAEFPSDGPTVKRHFHNLRKWITRNFPCGGVWFLEFQLRGAPHFHVLLTLKLWEIGPLTERVRVHNKLGVRKYRTHLDTEREFSRAWFRIVGSGDERHLRAGCSLEVVEEEQGALRYAACHAAKPHQKRVPKAFQNVGRFWGTIGNVKPSAPEFLPADAAEIFALIGPDAMSSRGRVKKYLWDASQVFTGSED